jgi:hypothetical protein
MIRDGRRRAEFDLLVTELSHGGDSFCRRECVALRRAVALSVIGALGYRGQVVVVLTPSLFLCRIGLWPERGFRELV